jgi:hypothetical protein
MFVKNITINLRMKWNKFKRCIHHYEKDDEQENHVQFEKPIPKEMLKSVNNCCQICENCYTNLTNLRYFDKLINSNMDSEYWFSKAMAYRGINKYDVALLHFLENNIVKMNNVEVFHNWLIRLQEADKPFMFWDELVSGKKTIDDFFKDDPAVKIHDSDNLKRLSNDFQVFEYN